jgi:hypothetical protein
MNVKRWILLNGCHAVALGSVMLFSGVSATLLSYAFGTVVMSFLYEVYGARCEG